MKYFENPLCESAFGFQIVGQIERRKINLSHFGAKISDWGAGAVNIKREFRNLAIYRESTLTDTAIFFFKKHKIHHEVLYHWKTL